jgi:hypothetical protein
VPEKEPAEFTKASRKITSNQITVLERDDFGAVCPAQPLGGSGHPAESLDLREGERPTFNRFSR